MGQVTLPNAARIYIDTVTVIYAVEQTPTYEAITSLPVVILDEVLAS